MKSKLPFRFHKIFSLPRTCVRWVDSGGESAATPVWGGGTEKVAAYLRNNPIRKVTPASVQISRCQDSDGHTPQAICSSEQGLHLHSPDESHIVDARLKLLMDCHT